MIRKSFWLNIWIRISGERGRKEGSRPIAGHRNRFRIGTVSVRSTGLRRNRPFAYCVRRGHGIWIFSSLPSTTFPFIYLFISYTVVWSNDGPPRERRADGRMSYDHLRRSPPTASRVVIVITNNMSGGGKNVPKLCSRAKRYWMTSRRRVGGG